MNLFHKNTQVKKGIYSVLHSFTQWKLHIEFNTIPLKICLLLTTFLFYGYFLYWDIRSAVFLGTLFTMVALLGINAFIYIQWKFLGHA